MYGIYANIGGILMVNVAIYSIHGSYGSYGYKHGNLTQRASGNRPRHQVPTEWTGADGWMGCESWGDHLPHETGLRMTSKGSKNAKINDIRKIRKHQLMVFDGIWWCFSLTFRDIFRQTMGKPGGKPPFHPPRAAPRTPRSRVQTTHHSHSGWNPQTLANFRHEHLGAWDVRHMYIYMYVCKWLCGSYSLIWSLTQFNWYNLHFLKFCQIESVHVLDFLNHTKSMCLLMLIWCMPIAVIYGNSNTLW